MYILYINSVYISSQCACLMYMLCVDVHLYLLVHVFMSMAHKWWKWLVMTPHHCPHPSRPHPNS